ncbi:MAG: ABC transporter permease [Lactobacillus sp.]|jgi:ABC-2 type transport system permease protein|nr:ABC transporter permease [Lactobacillus sp.]MCH3906034.1 ABC transporter permease [Lactobacillus sp.]
MYDLAKRRLKANFKQSLRYLSLVFNDFFVLALIFMLGALMFWYAQALKTMPVGQNFYKPLLAVLLWLPFLAGHFVTLFEPADEHFLLTQDRQLQSYLTPLFAYSMLLPTILLIAMGGILAPFALLKVQLPVVRYIGLLASIWILKIFQLSLQNKLLYFGWHCPLWVYNLLALATIILFTYNYALGISCFTVVLLLGVLGSRTVFNWSLVIETESKRKEGVYAFYSLFTDVDEKQIVIKRRKWLDFLLPKRLGWETPQSFLYRRTLLRNPEYLNLLVRMTAFAWLVSWLVQDYRWALGLSALVVILTLYQLRSLEHVFDYHLMYRVMPIDSAWQRRSLIRVLSLTLELQAVVIIIGWAIVLPKQTMLFLYMIFLLAITVFLVRIYLPLSLGGKHETQK